MKSLVSLCVVVDGETKDPQQIIEEVKGILREQDVPFDLVLYEIKTKVAYAYIEKETEEVVKT